MRITKEDYAKLKKLVDVVLEKEPTAKAEYIADGKSQTYFCWDVYHKVSSQATVTEKFWLHDLYSYLNDDHLETALKHITGKYPAK
jgi:hypothetical protein